MSSTLWKAGAGVAAAAATGFAAAAVAGVALLGGAVVGGPPAAAAPSQIPGLDSVLLDAYTKAAARAGEVAPGCAGVRWSILAGIAQVESAQAQGRTVAADGAVSPPIIGPRLDGSGAGGNTTAILDSDGGLWDGDTAYDRAVGVLQFIPSSWRAYGRDGNGNGTADPHNVYDNALGAVVHLCGSGPKDLSDPEQLRAALYAYNRSTSYVASVQSWIAQFDALAAAAQAAGPAVPVSGDRGGQVVAAAMAYLGTPYSWGGGGPGGPSEGFAQGAGTIGFDCSGLAQYAYSKVGISLPRVSAAQYNAGQRIPRSAGLAALVPGDLVFFAANPATGAGVHHVGIYVGGGQMVNAPRTGTVVRVEPVWMDSYAGGTRP